MTGHGKWQFTLNMILQCILAAGQRDMAISPCVGAQLEIFKWFNSIVQGECGGQFSNIESDVAGIAI